MTAALFEDALKAYESGEFEDSLKLTKEFLRHQKEDGRGWGGWGSFNIVADVSQFRCLRLREPPCMCRCDQ
ncbi:hypothetical protein [Thalassoglobus neptunius]|uniref:hypothetical protein n=1 Tax=Thalassoglobus neptunius TaxID=1938619 RepID=UPI0011B68DA1|nr:hypothetical protein [Thalassoglobus neptunius]